MRGAAPRRCGDRTVSPAVTCRRARDRVATLRRYMLARCSSSTATDRTAPRSLQVSAVVTTLCYRCLLLSTTAGE